LERVRRDKALRYVVDHVAFLSLLSSEWALLDIAKTDYYAIKANEAKREGFFAGYGQLPINWRKRVQLYKLYPCPGVAPVWWRVNCFREYSPQRLRGG